MTKFLHALIYAFLLLAPALGIISCSESREYRECNGVVWNTTFHIVYQGPHELSDSVLSVFSEVENSVSVFNPNSTVSAVNANTSDSTDLHFRNVYLKSREINAISGRRFDPTLAPLITAWGFGKGHKASEDTLRLDSLLELVGIAKTKLENDRLYKENPGISFNFSAIAKGYGVDCVAEMFLRNGVDNFLVEVGGEIYASGINRQGEKWSIAVDKPVLGSDLTNRESIMTLRLFGMGVATSGNYRNFHKEGANQYGHTISPITGRPVKTDVISATVIAPNTMDADALATTAMAVGSKEAFMICDSLKCGLMVVLDDFSTLSNSIFKSYVGEP